MSSEILKYIIIIIIILNMENGNSETWAPYDTSIELQNEKQDQRKIPNREKVEQKALLYSIHLFV